MTATKDLVSRIGHLHPCEDAAAWLAGFDDPAAAWAACERGDWLLWLLGKLSGGVGSKSRKKLALCACECARLAPPIKKPEWEAARLDCLDATERYARGEEGATLGIVRQKRAADAAAAAAYAAAYAAYTAAAYAADAAAYAAYAADAAAYAAADAAAYAAAYAAYTAAAYAADAAAAYAAADAAAYAADAAAYAAADAAAYAAADAARKKTLALAADIVRRHYPKPPLIRPTPASP